MLVSNFLRVSRFAICSFRRLQQISSCLPVAVVLEFPERFLWCPRSSINQCSTCLSSKKVLICGKRFCVKHRRTEFAAGNCMFHHSLLRKARKICTKYSCSLLKHWYCLRRQQSWSQVECETTDGSHTSSSSYRRVNFTTFLLRESEESPETFSVITVVTLSRFLRVCPLPVLM